MSATSRGTPRLQRALTQLPESAGLSPDADVPEHEQRLIRYYQHLADHVPRLPDPPRFSILLEDPEAAEALVAETVSSLRLQIWSDWELCISLRPGAVLSPPLQRMRDQTPHRLHVGEPADDANGRIQSAFTTATGDYTTILAAGDRPYPSALAEVVRAIDLERRLTGRAPDGMYSDERTIRADGGMHGDPLFKPGWSPILLRGGDYIGALAVYRTELLDKLGGPRAGAQGRHDLARTVGESRTMVHVPHVLVQRRSRPVIGSAPPPRTPPGRCSVVIPTRDQADLLSTCVTSVLERSDHPDLEVIIVDNGSTEPRARSVLAEVARDDRVSVLSLPGPFNFAQLCNAGVRAAAGDVVTLLNNDTEVIRSSWLSTLVAWASRPGIGAVGPQLRYPDGRIQHAGLAGMGNAGTGHLFVARDPSAESPLGLASVTREVLAVTGACLSVQRDTYWAVGGLDEAVVPNDSGDVDLCLRLRENGLVNLYVPEVVLVHHESPSRGRSFVDFERFYLQRRWPAALIADPYLNPHLARATRYEPDFRFGVPEVPPETFHRWLADERLPGVTAATD